MSGTVAGLPVPVIVGAACCALALATGFYLAVAPGRTKLPLERRRPDVALGPTRLEQTTAAATSAIDKLLRRRGAAGAAAALEQAGLKTQPKDFALLVVAGALAAVAVGTVLSGLILGLLLGLLAPVGAKVMLGLLARKRQHAFADQLDDSLQLMASSLRAGHSLLQALDSVSREAEEPTAGEFARIVNETRVGRPLAPALEEAAARMDSQDFLWVAQAIAINREVGGNLAEVLDGVGNTIRERNQIRRQVKALSAEGKMSAFVLLALPFGVTGFLSVSNPAYLAKFFQSLTGYILIVVAIIMLIVGALWLRKVVSFKF
ncbi:type II secretion system F family protein [Cumulibacter manganitolerans]|uniref:type II secretion system F family protein n=1 Tax=Cumulibacter manganitolerans TaxID=1884992 RepID=UPI001296C6BF|nr:type II secretion system F family protein [Cumulibacter manganitolerans]